MECPHIPEIRYKDLSWRLHAKSEQQRLPVAASMEITARCNLRCSHCYINLPAGDQRAQKRELSFSQWARIIDEIADSGCLWLLITGGEPLLRPDFPDIYLHAKKQGMIITLFFNGTLVTPALADLLQEWPPFQVEITAYGRTKATYESVTRIPGSYEKCLRGIDLLLERQIPLGLKTTLTTQNFQEVWEMKAWAQGLGLLFRFDAEINPRLDGGQEPLALRLTPEQVVEFDVRDEQRFQEWQRLIKEYDIPIEQSSGQLYNCYGGISSFHVDSFGHLHLCQMTHCPGFDLTRQSFAEGWEKFLPAIRARQTREDFPCRQCTLKVLCSQCPAWAQLENGDPETPVAFLCRLAHLRAQMLNISPQ
jgi:radical SAM protein with 4Fe4S-binding SPASM domain